MKSLQNLQNYSTSLPLLADDVVEFHAARIILLLKLCGRSGRITGLTKMAKLDFFVRYPQFFAIACEKLGKKQTPIATKTVESNMIRYHYGPWDQRYYHVLAYLESKGLVEIQKKGKTFKLGLTKLGRTVAKTLNSDPAFETLSQQMESVNEVLGSKRGAELKDLVYALFDKEVAQLPLEKVIK